jgi:hypothetical protein
MDAYITTIWYRNSDGTKTQSHFMTHGQQGNTDAVMAVDHDIKTAGATYGKVERVLETGGTKLVYERRA